MQDGEKPTWDDEFGGEEGYEYGMEENEDQGIEGEEGMAWAEGDNDMDEDDEAPINMVSLQPPLPSSVPLFFLRSHATDSSPFSLSLAGQDADFLDEPSTSSRKDKKKKKDKKDKKSKKNQDDDLAVVAIEGGEDEAPFVGTEEEKKKKVEEIMDEYYAMDHEDMVSRLLLPLLSFHPPLCSTRPLHPPSSVLSFR